MRRKRNMGGGEEEGEKTRKKGGNVRKGMGKGRTGVILPTHLETEKGDRGIVKRRGRERRRRRRRVVKTMMVMTIVLVVIIITRNGKPCQRGKECYRIFYYLSFQSLPIVMRSGINIIVIINAKTILSTLSLWLSHCFSGSLSLSYSFYAFPISRCRPHLLPSSIATPPPPPDLFSCQDPTAFSNQDRFNVFLSRIECNTK
mmetsp:Transcript_33475/g.60476  ORF Transcript_33475/g.60476 Transcript_33475/m.60476 type:complete len:201 (+) Transcript_33475:15-617(+)